MKPGNKERFIHVLEAILKIEDHTQGISEHEFVQNSLVQDAVLFQFSIIGEAVAHISPEILSKYSYPWHLVRGFRNYIAHEYFGINLKKVWATVKINIPDLKVMVNRILTEEFQK